MDVIGKYPIYEADQVLSAGHLNQSLAYLEKHDRLSRRLLHGIGIVCGLEFSYANGKLNITKGCGITSEGYLIALEKGLELTKVRKYMPASPPKYEPFFDADKKPFAFWEAVPQTEAEGESLQAISKINLDDKVLLLYLEAKDKDLKDCIGDDCDNNGTLREYTIRPLIISVVDLVKIFNQDGSSVDDIASATTGRYYLQESIPPRFNVTATALSTTKAITENYHSLADDYLPDLGAKLRLFEAFYARSLGMPEVMASELDKLQAKLDTIKKAELGAQYFFDYLCDLGAAYNELLDVATNWMVACMPDEDDFPMHLALGEFKNIRPNQPKLFRHYFKHAPSTPEAHRQLKHVKQLYNRLLKMLNAFDLEMQKEVRTIVSNYAKELSKKAIPYYFQPKNNADKSWLQNWSYKHSERNRWSSIGHYYNQPETQLLRDLEFQNFFRVEGHLGKQYGDAIAQLNDKIDKYRLPLKAIALSTGSVPFDLKLIDECRMEDINGKYETAVDAILCELQEISCFIGALPVPGANNESKKRLKTNETETGGVAASINVNTISGLNINTGYANLAGLATNLNRITLVAGKASKRFVKGQFIASRCSLKANTLGKLYLEYIQRDEVKGKSLLDLLLPYLNISNYEPRIRQLFLGYSFAIVVLDEIEELVGILSSSTISSLNFKALQGFSEELMAFLKLYILEINKLEREPEFETDVLLHDIKHYLVHLHSLCKLKGLFSLYDVYRDRILDALNELKFSRFIQKHPGIDHKAGVPKGGTFIMVYHSLEKPEERPDLRPKDVGALNTDATKLYTDLRAYNPSIRATAKAVNKQPSKVSIGEANNWMRDNLNQYASLTGKRINPALIDQFNTFLSGINLREEQEVDLEEGTVIADFYLPYICCSDCGGIEINVTEPLVPVTIDIERKRYCLGEEATQPIIVSPIGGEVSGPGVEKDDAGKFIFNPAADDVTVGRATFTYVFEGRTAQIQATILPKPEADFDVFIDASANGIFVSFENKSTNATQFEWDFGNGNTSANKDPEGQFYKLSQEQTIISLKAGNGVCDDVEVKTITLLNKEYLMRIGKERTSFCSNEGPQTIDLFIKNIGRESFPFDGVVKGKGVKEPSGTASPNFVFNPGEVAEGKHTLKYEVDGVVEAELDVIVAKAFNASFVARASATNDGMAVAFTQIKPTGKPEYRWFFDDQNPTNVETKTNASNFTKAYSPNALGSRKEITISLRVVDMPCIVLATKKIKIPTAQAGGNTNKTFNVSSVAKSFVVNSRPTGMSTNTVVTHIGGSTSPMTKGAQLLNGISEALKKPAEKKKLLNGSRNAALAKAFSEAITGIQGSFSKNRRKMNVKQRGEVMRFYGQMVVAMINIVGLLEKDLKTRESLATKLKLVGDNAAAMSKLDMSTTVKSAIKNRLSALAALNKPVAKAVAKSINAKL